jgi:hypothetical protein
MTRTKKQPNRVDELLDELLKDEVSSAIVTIRYPLNNKSWRQK